MYIYDRENSLTYQTAWLVEGVVVLARIRGQLDFEEARVLASDVATMMSKSDQPLVHLIVDLTQMAKMPTSIQKLAGEVSATLNHPQIGWAVAYGADSKIMNYLVSMILQVFKTRNRMFPTATEAITFLQEQDPNLPLLSVADIEAV